MRRSHRLKDTFVSYEDLADSGDDDASYMDRPSTSSAVAATNSPESVVAIVRAIIFRDQSKVPFTKSEIVKLALKTTKIDNNLWLEAEKGLQATFGFLIKPLPPPHDRLMILVKKNPSQIAISDLNHQPSNHDGILTVILGMIFMSNGSLEQKALLAAMSKLNVDESTAIILPNGIQKSLTFKDAIFSLWRKQMYLEINERRNVGKVFQWGQRAHLEVSKPKIFRWMAKVMNTKPEQWREQYRNAYDRELGPLSTITGEYEIINVPDKDENDDDDDDEIQVIFTGPPRPGPSRASSGMTRVKQERIDLD